jgi:hypothetical protein
VTKKSERSVSYLAFLEVAPGWWRCIPELSATSVYALRRELVARYPEASTLAILPVAKAHVVSYAKETVQMDLFKPATIAPAEETPEPPPWHDPGDPDAEHAAERALEAATAAEAEVRAATPPPPVDPDDDETPEDGVDPETGLSRRPASEARPEDEGSTVFPVDE